MQRAFVPQVNDARTDNFLHAKQDMERYPPFDPYRVLDPQSVAWVHDEVVRLEVRRLETNLLATPTHSRCPSSTTGHFLLRAPARVDSVDVQLPPRRLACSHLRPRFSAVDLCKPARASAGDPDGSAPGAPAWRAEDQRDRLGGAVEEPGVRGAHGMTCYRPSRPSLSGPADALVPIRSMKTCICLSRRFPSTRSWRPASRPIRRPHHPPLPVSPSPARTLRQRPHQPSTRSRRPKCLPLSTMRCSGCSRRRRSRRAWTKRPRKRSLPGSRCASYGDRQHPL